jgi:hypothetical protein
LSPALTVLCDLAVCDLVLFLVTLIVYTLAPSDDHGRFRREVRRMAVVATIAKGYDLDYMWASATATAGGYYISAAEAGEPPGRWWGPGAQALGFASGQVVERGPYDLLFGQRRGPDCRPLGRPLRREAAAERYRQVRDQLLAAEPHATKSGARSCGSRPPGGRGSRRCTWT